MSSEGDGSTDGLCYPRNEQCPMLRRVPNAKEPVPRLTGRSFFKRASWFHAALAGLPVGTWRGISLKYGSCSGSGASAVLPCFPNFTQQFFVRRYNRQESRH